MSRFSKEFAAALKRILYENGVPQSELAKRLGVSQSKTSYRLNGRRPVDTEMVVASSELLGVAPRDLLHLIMKKIGTPFTSSLFDAAALSQNFRVENQKFEKRLRTTKNSNRS